MQTNRIQVFPESIQKTSKEKYLYTVLANDQVILYDVNRIYDT